MHQNRKNVWKNQLWKDIWRKYRNPKNNRRRNHQIRRNPTNPKSTLHELLTPEWATRMTWANAPLLLLLLLKTLSKPRMALVDLTHGNKFQWNWNQNTVFINTNQFYSVVCKWQPFCLSPGLSSKHHLFICTTVVPSILLILKKYHHETFIHVFYRGSHFHIVCKISHLPKKQLSY